MKWFNLFQDEILRGLIKEALQANYDIRIAAQRVAGGGGTADGHPFRALSAIERAGRRRPYRRQFAPPVDAAGDFGVASWEIDLFGKMRRATEAARAEFLASQENQKAVMQTLVAQVATAYFDLREYDAELEYVRESIETRQESVKLVTARLEGGVANMLEVDQATTPGRFRPSRLRRCSRRLRSRRRTLSTSCWASRPVRSRAA